MIVFLFWVTIYYPVGAVSAGYLIQPWFVFSFVVIYTFHPVVEWFSQRRALFCGVITACCSSPTGMICFQPSIRTSMSFPFRSSTACGRGYCFT